MKLCKCGCPIYDEPEMPSDKCYWCMVESFREAVDKNIFLEGNFYENHYENHEPPETQKG